MNLAIRELISAASLWRAIALVLVVVGLHSYWATARESAARAARSQEVARVFERASFGGRAYWPSAPWSGAHGLLP